jgi:hypothetical protein
MLKLGRVFANGLMENRRRIIRAIGLSFVFASGLAVFHLVGGEAVVPVYGAKDCGAFTVTINGQAFRGPTRGIIPAGQLPPGSTAVVTGTFVEFTVNLDTFTVHDYTLTGAASPNQITPERTVLFTRKEPHHGVTLTSDLALRIDAEGTVLERSGGEQDMKIQAKDCNQGGVFQMEPEPRVTATNTLGPGFSYCFQKSLVAEQGADRSAPRFFTNGVVLGFDSPQPRPDDPVEQCAVGDLENACTFLVAPETLPQDAAPQSQTFALWSIADGGRVGMVLGEDAQESLDPRGGGAFCPHQTP